jgi:thiol-disulfide isomerase/thioredoxin
LSHALYRPRIGLALLLLLLSVIAGAAVSAEAENSSRNPGRALGWRLVNYWSESCSPCRKEIPMLNALSRELAPRDIHVVGINFEEDPWQDTLEVARRLGIEFPTLTPNEVERLPLRAPDAMPTTYLLTPDNEVAAKLIGMQTRLQIIHLLSQFDLLDDE